MKWKETGIVRDLLALPVTVTDLKVFHDTFLAVDNNLLIGCTECTYQKESKRFQWEIYNHQLT